MTLRLINQVWYRRQKCIAGVSWRLSRWGSSRPVSRCTLLPSKREALSRCCFNVGPTSKTAVQHLNRIGSTSRVCWVHSFVLPSLTHQSALAFDGSFSCFSSVRISWNYQSPLFMYDRNSSLRGDDMMLEVLSVMVQVPVSWVRGRQTCGEAFLVHGVSAIHPRNHQTLIPGLYNAGPASQALDQRLVFSWLPGCDLGLDTSDVDLMLYWCWADGLQVGPFCCRLLDSVWLILLRSLGL